jgi:hypothetical protein
MNLAKRARQRLSRRERVPRFLVAIVPVALAGPLILVPGVPSVGAASPERAVVTGGCFAASLPGGTAVENYIEIDVYGLPSGGTNQFNYSVAQAGYAGAYAPTLPVTFVGTSGGTTVPEWQGAGPYTLTVTWAASDGSSGTLPPVAINLPTMAQCQSGSGFSTVGTPPGQQVTAPIVALASSPDGNGYWEVGSDGRVYSFGDAYGVFQNSLALTTLNHPVVGMASTPDGRGYWLVASDGGIFAYGDAPFFGSTGGIRLNKPIVGMAATPDGGGYWLVASDGGIFAFGDAQFFGSTGSMRLNQPIVGMATDGATGGYWLVASDGGIFSYNAPFFGSTGSLHLNKPIVGMQAASDGSGYRFVASDGGVFAYNESFAGSTGGRVLNQPIIGMAAASSGGYWLGAKDGGIFSFSAPFYGSPT